MKQLDKMNVNFRLKPEKYKKLKILCVEKGVSMQKFLEDLIEVNVK